LSSNQAVGTAAHRFAGLSRSILISGDELAAY